MFFIPDNFLVLYLLVTAVMQKIQMMNIVKMKVSYSVYCWTEDEVTRNKNITHYGRNNGSLFIAKIAFRFHTTMFDLCSDRSFYFNIDRHTK